MTFPGSGLARPGVAPEGPSTGQPGQSPRIVALGGGTGLPAVLEGLSRAAELRGVKDPEAVIGIVTVTDDGGSSGRLRDQFGVLPPGDARNCLLALTAADSKFRELLQHRLDEGAGVVGHPVGNLLLTALTQRTGDFSAAIAQLGTMIGSRGRVLPATLENVRLRAELESGETVTGETRIVRHPSRIGRLSLEPRPKAHPEVLNALVAADGIVVGPGSLYTSVLPTLLVESVAKTIRKARGVRIYVANLMTEPGETDDYSLDDHLRVIRAHAGFHLFDYVLVNRRPVTHSAVSRYAASGSQPVAVEPLLLHAAHAQVIECDLATEVLGTKIRHHPDSLARAIRALVTAGRPRQSSAKKAVTAQRNAAMTNLSESTGSRSARRKSPLGASTRATQPIGLTINTHPPCI